MSFLIQPLDPAFRPQVLIGVDRYDHALQLASTENVLWAVPFTVTEWDRPTDTYCLRAIIDAE